MRQAKKGNGIDEYDNFVGPSRTGGIKNYFMQHFNKSLNNMILNSSNEMENDL